VADTAGDWLIPTVTAPGQIWMLYRVSLAARAGEDRRRASGPVSSRPQAKCPPRAKPAAWARSGSHPAPPGLTTARHLPHDVPVAPDVPCSDASRFPVQRALPFHMTSAEVSGPRHVEQRARGRCRLMAHRVQQPGRLESLPAECFSEMARASTALASALASSTLNRVALTSPAPGGSNATPFGSM